MRRVASLTCTFELFADVYVIMLSVFYLGLASSSLFGFGTLLDLFYFYSLAWYRPLNFFSVILKLVLRVNVVVESWTLNFLFFWAIRSSILNLILPMESNFRSKFDFLCKHYISMVSSDFILYRDIWNLLFLNFLSSIPFRSDYSDVSGELDPKYFILTLN